MRRSNTESEERGGAILTVKNEEESTLNGEKIEATLTVKNEACKAGKGRNHD